MMPNSRNNVNDVMFAGQHLLRSDKSLSRPACLIKTSGNDSAEPFGQRQVDHKGIVHKNILATTQKEMQAFARAIEKEHLELLTDLYSLRSLADKDGAQQLHRFDNAWKEYLIINR